MTRLLAAAAMAALLSAGPGAGPEQNPDRLHRDVGLRLGDGRDRRGHLQEAWPRRRDGADRHQLEYPGRDPLQLDPDRRTDLHRVPAGRRRRPRSGRGRRRYRHEPGHRTATSPPSSATASPSRSRRISSARRSARPGLGAFLHVLFVKWLVEKGVDPKRVNFVEVTFPTMTDIVKSGASMRC